FPFWLDMQKPAERELADQIELLKNDRSFAATVRNGIRLMIDLRAGRLDVLLELFPWIGERLSSGAGRPGDDDVKRELQRLQDLILRSGINSPGGNHPVMKPITPPLPTFDDDDDSGLTVAVKRVSDNGESGMNFLSSLSGV